VPALVALLGIGWAVAGSAPASAGVAVELSFVERNGVAIPPADTVAAASGDTLVLRVVLHNTEPLTAAAFHLAFDLADEELNVVSAVQWSGVPSGLACDVNGDRVTNIADFLILQPHFNQPVPPAPAEADCNADGIVNIADVLLFQAEFNATSAATFAPWIPLKPPVDGVPGRVGPFHGLTDGFDPPATLRPGSYELGTVTWVVTDSKTDGADILSGLFTGIDGFGDAAFESIDEQVQFNSATVNALP
jgi:hypothetical protein